MQYKDILTHNQVIEIIEFILSDSNNELYESYSEMGKEIIKFKDLNHFENYLSNAITNNLRKLSIGIYNSKSKGKFFISKIELNPKFCKGNTFRYRIDGWAIIFINLILNSNKIEFRVSVNTKKRAEKWFEIKSEFGNPELWEWKNVEIITRKIIHKIKTTHNNSLAK
ncbi:hypothetical protein [Flavobacterium sp. I3-2]|uniref:hypothetical protein n=1 Tax=Flavobacterium sp. I3-2 TaxID=2748319 RepID=UPI0015B2A5D8|nr:hypothetical protein [Flavobacterium sp. I3-2]